MAVEYAFLILAAGAFGWWYLSWVVLMLRDWHEFWWHLSKEFGGGIFVVVNCILTVLFLAKFIMLVAN
jgi:hypothetical protein